jgi:hypothetical protein
MRDFTLDEVPDKGCFFITPALVAVGVGATTAAVAGPILAVGLGAGISAATGGDPLQGALLGGGISALGGFSGLTGDIGGAVGVGGIPGLGAASGLSSLFAPSAVPGGALSGINPSSAGGNIWDTAGTGANGLSIDPTVAGSGIGALSQVAGPQAATAAATNAGSGSGLFKALGALSSLGQAFTKPQIGTWPTPGPANNSATLGPTWNQPLTPIPQQQQRQAVNPLAGQPASSWYTIGQLPEQTYFTNNRAPLGYAKGGALTMHHNFSTGRGEHYVQGGGDGQSDSEPARLSDGEYVLDATTVSRLGNGSNRAGSKKLDAFRERVARDAGATRVVQKKVGNGALNALAGTR